MIVSVCPHRNSDHCLFGHTTPNNRYHHIQIHCCLFKKVPSCEEENVKDIGGIWQVKPKPGILMIARRSDVRPNSGYGRAALYTWSNTDPCPVPAALSLFGHYGNPQATATHRSAHSNISQNLQIGPTCLSWKLNDLEWPKMARSTWDIIPRDCPAHLWHSIPDRKVLVFFHVGNSFSASFGCTWSLNIATAED